jgi:hypothetical protein
MYKYTELARRIMVNSFMAFDEPDPITVLEQNWIYNTNCNSIIFTESCDLDKAYDYDKRSCYPSIMCDDKFTFPVKEGRFVKLEKLPETYLSYGIYRVNISRSNDDKIDRFFRFNSFNYYTHYHINAAKMLGLNVGLIIDDEANALLYEKGRANGHTYFHQLIMELYKLKSESELAKPLLSCLWGVLCSKKIIKKSTVNKLINLKNKKIEYINPIYGDNVMVGYMSDKQFYKYDYARIGVFLTSRNCEKMVKELLPFNDHIKRFHTDGFISDIPIPLNIGDNIGDWKFEKEGKCKITNSNKIIWY